MKDTGAPTWAKGSVVLVLLLLSLFMVSQASTAVGEAESASPETRGFALPAPSLVAMAGPFASAEASSEVNPAPASITESDFEPEVVTVRAGTVIEWTNLTSETVHVVGVAQYRIYLLAISTVGTQIRPLVRRRQGHDYRSAEAKSTKRNDHNEASDVLATSHPEEPLG